MERKNANSDHFSGKLPPHAGWLTAATHRRGSRDARKNGGRHGKVLWILRRRNADVPSFFVFLPYINPQYHEQMIHTITGHLTAELGAVALVLAVLGTIVAMGKGDWLIAGYNTASKRRRATYDIRRLRRVIAGLLWVCAAHCLSFIYLADNPRYVAVSAAVFGGIVLLAVVLCSTWAKRR